MRSGRIRREFFTRSMIVTAPGLDTVNGSTRLVENGPNNKVQDMTTTYAQSDYSNQFGWFGLKHNVLTGVDAAHEVFNGYATVLPAGAPLV